LAALSLTIRILDLLSQILESFGEETATAAVISVVAKAPKRQSEEDSQGLSRLVSEGFQQKGF
jgi:hypothetical protein